MSRKSVIIYLPFESNDRKMVVQAPLQAVIQQLFGLLHCSLEFQLGNSEFLLMLIKFCAARRTFLNSVFLRLDHFLNEDLNLEKNFFMQLFLVNFGDAFVMSKSLFLSIQIAGCQRSSYVHCVRYASALLLRATSSLQVGAGINSNHLYQFSKRLIAKQNRNNLIS